MDWTELVLAFAGGYVAAIFTWDRVHTFVIGAQTKARQLRARALALEVQLQSFKL